MFEIPKVKADDVGATSKWLAKWPHELQANNAMHTEINLYKIKIILKLK